MLRLTPPVIAVRMQFYAVEIARYVPADRPIHAMY